MPTVIDLISDEEEEEEEEKGSTLNTTTTHNNKNNKDDDDHDDDDESDAEDSIITKFVETLFLSCKTTTTITTTTRKRVNESGVVTKLYFDDSTLRHARNLFTSVSIETGQSDKEGVGIIAKRDLNVGESFLDEYAIYQHGKVPKHWENDERGNYIKSKDGYFILRPSSTEWMNEARCNKHEYSNDKCNDCKKLKNVDLRISLQHDKKMLQWKITRPIPKGTELLTFYGASGS